MMTHLGTQSRPTSLQGGADSSLGEALAKIPDEPFLSVERHLVAWSVILGLTLLGALVWVSQRFFTG